MDLYCWPHNTVHTFTPGEVEQVVYALTAMVFDADQRDQSGEEYSPNLLACPQTALSLAQDSECYLEQVEQGVECRKELAR
jgi:hypothetical protein